jgi:hypothetical protein
MLTGCNEEGEIIDGESSCRSRSFILVAVRNRG